MALGLTGSKNGCGTELYGSCGVILDGKTRRDSLLKVPRLDGADIETGEGLGGGGRHHRLRKPFMDDGAAPYVCCTPGSLTLIKALLDQPIALTRSELENAPSGNRNLCRCACCVKSFAAIGGCGTPPDMFRRAPMFA